MNAYIFKKRNSNGGSFVPLKHLFTVEFLFSIAWRKIEGFMQSLVLWTLICINASAAFREMTGYSLFPLSLFFLFS